MVFYTKLSGVSYNNEDNEHRQVVIFQLKRRGLLEEGQELLFQHQPWNCFDKNAIAVFGPDKRQMGFLPKDMATNVCEAIKTGLAVNIHVSAVTGGALGELFGVNVKVVIEQTLGYVIEKAKKLTNDINNDSNSKNLNSAYDDDTIDYFYEKEQYDWNPYDLDEQEYENWLDSLNK